MGWSCTQAQSKTLERLQAWEQAQPGYAKEDGQQPFYFFESNEITGKDFGTTKNPNLPQEIYEVHGKTAYRRGSLYITPDGQIVNRSYVKFDGLDI